MTSFPAQARRVRDSALSPQRRLYALRECTLHCAPYGFRATWHHLVVAARIPSRLTDDPDALVRAADELQRTRDVVLHRAQEYAALRHREKAAGRRTPRTPPPWNSWGWSGIAYCPDPEHHPTGPLVTVVRAVFHRYDAGVDVDRHCLACGTERCRPGRACPTCGVHPDGPAARWRASRIEERWQRAWRRELDDRPTPLGP
ncbi:hypothetical protein I0C86_14910 [Plantactinospora sp. S1510]|uniref:Uncharacterized protein n=1 Tax=Plantactinospora alkalitolerans TaxID=2789879 RepID=A0ABS0GVL3_9ACTN|nr:hypothetical protein [Plantactinospora alkalitolerans]MBF9130235.1 hypothetical protein [Plantactinospora alkalitolerans]